MGDSFMNLDSNPQPIVHPPPLPSPPAPSPPGFGSFYNEHETPIEDRIRFAIRASDRHPQTSVTSAIEPVGGVNQFKNHKRDRTHLAKALEMDLEPKKTDLDKGVLFNCNICLGMAKDPILTCCGHLFCWGCFYQVPNVDSVSKECPVCNGEVIDSNVTPIYGNGWESNSGVGNRIPPRPQAHRVEGVGQEGLFHHTVMEAVRRIRDGDVEIDLGQSGANSVVHASVSIQADGDVEVDLAVTGPRRRRRRRLVR